MLTLAFTLASILALARANDWNTPCTSGACGYIWAGDGKTATSSMMLAGPDQVLSDITPAAGWQIMGCDPNWSKGAHDIRLVCAGTPEQMANCQHLYDHGGAEETVVRLPDSCGAGPFARVQKTYVPSDQSVPSNLTKLVRRVLAPQGGGSSTNSTPPAVRGLTLDYNFSQVPTSRGKLVLGVASSNVGSRPLTRRDLNLRKRGRGRQLAQRGFFSDFGNGVAGAFDDAKSAAGAAIDDVTSAAGAVAGKATSVAGKVIDKATSAAGEAADVVTSDAAKAFNKATSAVASVATAAATAVVKGINEVKDATSFNKTDNSGVLPIQFTDSFTLLDASIACEGGKSKVSGSASLHIDVDTDVNAKVSFGYTFVGSIVPLKLDDVAVFASMSGDASATFNVDASAQGTFDTLPIALFKSGLPGLSIPGIVALGPEFSVNTQLQMELDLEAQLSVTADFGFPNIDMVFPKSHGKSTGAAQAKDTANPVKLSTHQSVDVTGSITAHLIPRVDFGIDIGDGIAKATIFLDLDISGKLALAVHEGSNATKTLGAASANATEAANATAVDDGATAKNGTDATDKAAAKNGTNAGAGAGATKNAAQTAKAGAAASAAQAKDTSNPTSAATKSKAAKSTAPAKAAASAKSKSNTKAVAKATTKRKRAPDVGGCVTLTGAIGINAGLQGKLEPIFDQEVTFPIFSTSKQLFQKCFGDPAATAKVKAAARSISGGSTAAQLYRRAAKAPAKAAPAGGTKNEITPEKSKGSTSKLSCGSAISPFGSLTSLI